MDPNDPRKRLLALQQSNPSIRQQAAPKQVRTTTLYSNDGPKQVQVFSTDNKNFRNAQESAAIDQQQPQKQTYRGITLGPEKQKTIFGHNAAWLLPKSLEKTRSVTAAGDITDTADNFLKRFDSTDEEARRLYVNQLHSQAANDPTAARTMQLLNDQGRFKGNLADFASGFNEKLGGGLVRGVARGTDFVLPGHNTFGLERFADQMEGPKQYTQAGQTGEKAGSVAKGAVDVAGLFAGSGIAEAAAGKVSAFGNLVDKLSKGGKVSQMVAKAIGVIPGSIGGSATQSIQDAGKGDKQNVGKNVAIGLAADLGLGALGSGLKFLRGKGKEIGEVSHVTKLSSLEDILKDGELKPGTNNLPGYEGQNAVFMQEGLQNPYTHPGEDNIKIVYKEDKLGKNVTKNGDEIAVADNVKATPDNVERIEVPNQEVADQLEAKGYKTKIDESLSAANNPVPGTNIPVQIAPSEADLAQNFSTEFEKLSKSMDSEMRAIAKKPELTRQQLADEISARYEQKLNDLVDAHHNGTLGATPAKATAPVKAAAESTPVTETQKAAQDVAEMPAVAATDVPVSASQEATSVGDTVAASADQNAKAIDAGAIVGNDDPNKDAVQQILDQLNTAQSTYKVAAKSRTAERAQRAAAAEEAYQAAGGGEAGMRAKLATLRGKYTESGFSPITVDETAQKAILDDIAASDLRGFEKLNTQNAIRKIWGANEAKPTPSDIKYISDYFGKDFGDAVEQAVKEGGSSWREKIGNIAGLPKSIMASYDISGTLRQGGVLASRFPKQFKNAFKEELKYFASEDAFKAGMAEIKARPSFESMVNSKLAVDAAEGLTGTEEQFVSNLAEKIPGFGKGVKASDRAYSGFLTKFRADVFDTLTQGKEYGDKELSDIAKFINSATGRGDLGPYLQKHTQTLSTALFSPKLWKSRLDLLNPVYYAKLSPPARKVALQTAGTFAAEASAVLSVAAMAGAQVETDLRSSDFGKIKVGNTRYDILGGLQQNLVFAWREISGEKKNSETGDVKSLTEGGFGAKDRVGIAGDMVENKANPLIGAGLRIWRGKDRGGNPVNPLTELAKLAIPLPISGAVQTAQDLGDATNPTDLLKGALMNSPDAIGISSQTYGSVATKDKGKVQANGVPAFKGKVTPDMVTDTSGQPILDDKGKPVKVKFPEGATELQKQAMIDDKRNSALSDQYKRTHSAEDQALMGLSDSQLEGYVKAGKISQEKYNEIQDNQQIIKNIKGVKVPDGVKSDAAYRFYQMYNGLNKRQQDEYMNGPADEPAKQITDLVNGKLPKGLQKLQATNQLAKDYADFEKDMNTHDYTDIEKNNKLKSFYTSTYKSQQPQHVQDIYKEGGSEDIKSFIENGALSKEDLDAAVKLDNELYQAGLTGLKFSKKFRETYGYDLPSNYTARTGKSSKDIPKQVRASLAALMPNVKKQEASPEFSSRSRLVGKKLGNYVPKSSGQNKKISIKL